LINMRKSYSLELSFAADVESQPANYSIISKVNDVMRLPERDPYAPREWQPHEKPALLGSPSTRTQYAKRIAYGVVGLLVCLTGALGNAVVTANLQNLQGTFGAWSTEIAWLPAVYVMTNISINLLLVKFRQQYGLRAFTEGFWCCMCWSPFSTCSLTISARR
jgi:hypothetical protein